MKYDSSNNYTNFRNQFKDFQRQYAYYVCFLGGLYNEVGLNSSAFYPQKVKIDSVSIDTANTTQGYGNVLRNIPAGFFTPRKISMMFEMSREKSQGIYGKFEEIIRAIGGDPPDYSYAAIRPMSVIIELVDENGSNANSLKINECWPVSIVNANLSSLGEDGYVTFQVNFIANK